MNIRTMFVYVVIFLSTSSAFAQEYDIRFTRPTHIGAQYRLVASGQQVEETRVASSKEVIENAKQFFSIQLEGVVTVLQIDEHKRENKIKLLVSTCLLSKEEHSMESEALPTGTEMVIQLREGDEEVFVNGEPADDDIVKMVKMVNLLYAREVTDDDMFGTKEPKKVGDYWAINTIEATKDLADEGVQIAIEDVHGTTTLEKVAVVDGIDCLQLAIAMEITKAVPPLPPGVHLESSRVVAQVSGMLPIDTSLRVLSSAKNMSMELVAKGTMQPNTPEVTVSIKNTLSLQAAYKPI